MRRLAPLVVGLALAVASFATVWPLLEPFLAADSCLANAGSYDLVRNACVFAQPHAAAAFPVWRFWGALAGAWAGLSYAGLALHRRTRRRPGAPNLLTRRGMGRALLRALSP
jgi:hypothetical protein